MRFVDTLDPVLILARTLRQFLGDLINTAIGEAAHWGQELYSLTDVKFMDMHGVSAPTRKRLYHTRGGRVLGHHGGGEGKRHSLRAGTVIQVASGDSASVWAMEIGDMSFAATNLVANGKEIPISDIGMSDVLTAASSVNATYILVDSDVINLGMTHLLPYFDVNASSLGETFSILPDSSRSSVLTQSETGTTLKLVYVNGSAPAKVIIYEIATK